MSSPIDRKATFGEIEGAVERIDPAHFEGRVQREHVARYRWAARFAQGEDVLDVACGTGYGSALLLKSGARAVVGADISVEALAFARKSHGVRSAAADGGHLPMRRSTFGLITCFETIEHVPDSQAMLLELHRVLRAEGTLLLSTPNADLSDGTNPYHVKEFTAAELRSALNDSGFIIRSWLGQCWRLRGGYAKLRGIRRLGWQLEGWARPTRSVPAARPTYFCVALAKRAGT